MRIIFKILVSLLYRGYVYEEGRSWNEYTKKWYFAVYIYPRDTDPNMGFVASDVSRISCLRTWVTCKKYFKGDRFSCFPHKKTK